MNDRAFLLDLYKYVEQTVHEEANAIDTDSAKKRNRFLCGRLGMIAKKIDAQLLRHVDPSAISAAMAYERPPTTTPEQPL